MNKNYNETRKILFYYYLFHLIYLIILKNFKFINKYKYKLNTVNEIEINLKNLLFYISNISKF